MPLLRALGRSMELEQLARRLESAEGDRVRRAGRARSALRSSATSVCSPRRQRTLALATLDCEDATLLRVMEAAYQPACLPEPAPAAAHMIDTLLALGAVEVLDGTPPPLARSRRRPEAQLVSGGPPRRASTVGTPRSRPTCGSASACCRDPRRR